jgi:hypothetical protein
MFEMFPRHKQYFIFISNIYGTIIQVTVRRNFTKFFYPLDFSRAFNFTEVKNIISTIHYSEIRNKSPCTEKVPTERIQACVITRNIRQE